MHVNRIRWGVTILREVQEWIEAIRADNDKLQRELNLYLRIQAELGTNKVDEQDSSEQDKESYGVDNISIEIIPDSKAQGGPKGKRKNKKDLRQEALEKARAWHLDGLRSKGKKK